MLLVLLLLLLVASPYNIITERRKKKRRRRWPRTRLDIATLIDRSACTAYQCAKSSSNFNCKHKIVTFTTCTSILVLVVLICLLILRKDNVQAIFTSITRPFKYGHAFLATQFASFAKRQMFGIGCRVYIVVVWSAHIWSLLLARFCFPDTGLEV